MSYYCTNTINQYLATDDEDGTCPTPVTPTESFGYDADGNLVADGTFTYTWDGEDRLIRVQTRLEQQQWDESDLGDVNGAQLLSDAKLL